MAFRVRGALPWHNFLSGPTTWDEPEYEQYLNWMQKLGLNLLVLHCYTGGSERYVNYVEPMIRMEYRSVVPEARFDTSMTARWGYRPLGVKQFAFDTGRLFPSPDGAEAFGSRAAVLARSNEDRYRLAQALIQRVIQMAHARGIQVAMGFEFGVYPPELYSIVSPDSINHRRLIPDPSHPASIEVLRLTLDNILAAYPEIDWVWLWLNEMAGLDKPPLSPAIDALVVQNRDLFEADIKDTTLFTGVWSLTYIRAAHAYLSQRAPQVRLALSGWGGDQMPALLRGLDRGLPGAIVFTCLNPGLGKLPQPSVLADIAQHREVLAIPWLEGDNTLWHPQPRVSLLREHVLLAHQQKLAGVVAIHWRTEDVRMNMEAFAGFARAPENPASVEAFYELEGRKQYGEVAAQELVPLLVRMDREQWFAPLVSPEYSVYGPSWGRLEPELRQRLERVKQLADKLAEQSVDANHQSNLRWLAATIRFTLLLDEVSRDIEPAYRLKDDWLLGKVAPDVMEKRIAASRQALAVTPVEQLLRTYAGRVRSRGELGVLSSLNQRVWLQYQELRQFLEERASEAPTEPGFTPVFNGKDLTGWAGPVDEYEVKEGALRCKPGKGDTIYFNQEYSDFIVRFEFKLPKGGNNGLAIRYPGRGNTAYVGMCELQVLDDNYEQATGDQIDPRQAHGSAYGMVAAKRGCQRPIGEWNYQEVTVKGSTLKVELNGTVILDCDLSEVTEYMDKSAHPGKDRQSGYFGFAGHNDPVQFRHIRIKPL